MVRCCVNTCTYECEYDRGEIGPGELDGTGVPTAWKCNYYNHNYDMTPWYKPRKEE